MTELELKQTCFNRGISFIPHHECGVCGEPTGWYLFERWPPYEVAYSKRRGIELEVIGGGEYGFYLKCVVEPEKGE